MRIVFACELDVHRCCAPADVLCDWWRSTRRPTAKRRRFVNEPSSTSTRRCTLLSRGSKCAISCGYCCCCFRRAVSVAFRRWMIDAVVDLIVLCMMVWNVIVSVFEFFVVGFVSAGGKFAIFWNFWGCVWVGSAIAGSLGELMWFEIFGLPTLSRRNKRHWNIHYARGPRRCKFLEAGVQD